MRTFCLLFTVLSLLPTVAGAQTVRITEADCGRLTVHSPDADVAYRPGVDAAGNAVAPADLYPTPPISAPEVVTIPITLDLASRLGIPPGGNADYLARPVIGEVTVTQDGRVAFNGIPLTSDEQYQLSRLCQQEAARE